MNRMEKPKYGKQQSAKRPFSLSKALPSSVPRSAVATPSRPRPQVGKPNPGGRVKGPRNG